MSRIAGLFVGGQGRRMGGAAKGLLRAPDGQPIVQRTRALLEIEGVRCVLVGAHPAYEALGLDTLVDDPRAGGPLAGLLALFAYAQRGEVLAIAADMPHLTPRLIRRLLDAPPAPAVAPRREVWEPLFARYDAANAWPVALELARRGELRLQSLLDALHAVPLPLAPGDDAALRDWDTPEDVVASTAS